MASKDVLADTLAELLTSPNVPDANLEPANLVDVVHQVARAILSASRHLGTGDAATPMGAIEAHGKMMTDAAQKVADAILELAEAVRERG